MTLDYKKPSIPDYLSNAMQNAAAALEEGNHISDAIHDVEKRQASIGKDIQAQEEALGDLEAESLLRRKPDGAKITKSQDKLDALHAEQRKLQAAEKSLHQKSVEQDRAIVDTCGALMEARRDFGSAVTDLLDAELKRLCLPIQDILHVARVLHNVWDHSPLRNRYEDVHVSTFRDGTALLGSNSYPSYGSPSPAEASRLAAAWKEAISPVRAMMDRVMPTTNHIKEDWRRQEDRDALERERAERLKPRYI